MGRGGMEGVEDMKGHPYVWRGGSGFSLYTGILQVTVSRLPHLLESLFAY